MVRFEKPTVEPSDLYCSVNVFEPAVKLVISVVVLAWIGLVALMMARASVAACVVAPETAKLRNASSPPPGST